LKTVVRSAGELGTRTDVFIGVDEVRKLLDKDSDRTGDCIKLITSTLGQLAHGLREAGVACVFSALTASTFSTLSERSVYPLDYVAADSSAKEAVLKELFPQELPSAWTIAMIEACAGTHFRSLVVACTFLKDRVQHGVELTVPQLFREIQQRLTANMSSDEKSDVKTYVINRVKMDHTNALECAPLAAPFIDANGAVAPVLLIIAFQADTSASNLLMQFFSTSARIEATKQLELCGMLYDQFRAHFHLPVVPFGVVVNNVGAQNWSEFRFNEHVATSSIYEESLLQCPKGEVEATDSAKRIPPSTKALQCTQDKINKDGFSAAVSDLNTAADVLTKVVDVPVLWACFGSKHRNNRRGI
jgi:hypothetical protein